MAVREDVDQVFETATSQSEAIIAIYKMFVPNWDDIERINGWPCCSEEMWRYICIKFQRLDQKLHPDVMPGGLWLSKGFSNLKTLKGWEVDISGCTITYKQGAYQAGV